jgi:hypothetical protein
VKEVLDGLLWLRRAGGWLAWEHDNWALALVGARRNRLAPSSTHASPSPRTCTRRWTVVYVSACLVTSAALPIGPRLYRSTQWQWKVITVSPIQPRQCSPRRGHS